MYCPHFFSKQVVCGAHLRSLTEAILTSIFEGDPRSNANSSVISSTFGISKNDLLVYHNILSVL